jgi:hypothetical protein
VTTLRRRLDALLEQCHFPVTRADLLAVLGDDDLDLVQAIEAIDDDTFASRAELEHRLDEALGVPDAVVSHSALDADNEWAPPPD